MNTKKLLYVLIVLGIMLRFVKFGSLPLSLNRDEAALGYNAWSITQAGIDEWGQKYPLMFKSFGDYKLPGYIYTLSALISFFDVSEIIIRLPSLVAGISIIFIAFFLAKQSGFSKTNSLFISAVISISPWAIYYSRIGFEANLGLSLFLLSMLLITSKRLSIALLGTATYALSILTYNTPLMIFPILLIWLFLNLDKKFTKRKIILASVITAISISWSFIISPLISQKSGITIFSDPTITSMQVEKYSNSANLITRTLNHKYVFPIKIILKNTISTFSPRFLNLQGGENPWHNAPNTGHIYLASYLLFLASLFKINKQSFKDKKFLLPLLLLVFGIIPAIITSDAPHATRSLIVFVGITIMSAFTWKDLKKISQYVLLLVLLIEVSIYSYKYFYSFPKNHSSMWHVGLKEKITEARELYPDKTINITVPQNQPYIYSLLFEETDPKIYIDTVEYYGPDSAGIEYVKQYQGWSFIGDIKDTPEGTINIHQNEQGIYQIIENKE